MPLVDPMTEPQTIAHSAIGSSGIGSSGIAPATIAWDAQGALEVLTFDLGGQTFAIEATALREIIDPLPETVVPGADPLISAVINFRGQVIPLADLRVAFGMPRGPLGADARLVVLEIALDGQPLHIAIGTERVNEVTSLHATQAQAAPSLGLRWPRELARALVRRDGDVVVLPDLAAVFAPVLRQAERSGLLAA